MLKNQFSEIIMSNLYHGKPNFQKGTAGVAFSIILLQKKPMQAHKYTVPVHLAKAGRCSAAAVPFIMHIATSISGFLKHNKKSVVYDNEHIACCSIVIKHTAGLANRSIGQVITSLILWVSVPRSTIKNGDHK